LRARFDHDLAGPVAALLELRRVCRLDHHQHDGKSRERDEKKKNLTKEGHHGCELLC
jgi:hypothetical protein